VGVEWNNNVSSTAAAAVASGQWAVASQQ